MRISEQVEGILRVSRAARNSDRELLLIYFQKFGMDLSPRQIELFRQMPSTETIRRTRQSLQEKGKYPADQAVEEARFEKYKAVKQGIGYETPEALLEQQGYTVLEWGER